MFQYVGLQIEHRQVFFVVGKDNISRNVHVRFSVQMLMGGRPCRINLNTVCHVLYVSSGMGFTCVVLFLQLSHIHPTKHITCEYFF